MATTPRLPQGNDPRLKLDPNDLEAASERALPQVARASNFGDHIGTAAGIIGVAALGGIAFLTLSSHKPPPPAPTPVIQPPPPHYSALPPINPDLHPMESSPVVVQPVAPAPVVTAVPVDANAGKAPAMVIDNSIAASSSSAASSAAMAAAQLAGKTALNANDQFLASQNSDVSQKATKIGDPSQVVPQGTIIPAVLETAINSDLPGYTRAIVSRDIRSFDGTAVLIPRGSHLIGQYKSGLASGETRAFIIWNRLIRPDGVSVELASPATDDLGQAGMSGSVDSHFVKRFGSAILLSIVNGIASAIGNNSSGSSTIVIGSSGAAQGVIGDALSTDAKIPPTIKVPQGASIEVFAARDLDFDLGK